MKPKKPNSQKYLKYSGMAMQLFGLNLMAILIGKWADKQLELEKGYVSMALILIFNIGFFYALYLDLTRNDDDDN
jgi:hypothetical protein